MSSSPVRLRANNKNEGVRVLARAPSLHKEVII